MKNQVKITIENSMPAFQRIVGLFGRNKVHTRSLDFKASPDNVKHAEINVELSGDSLNVNRVISQLSRNIEVIAVDLEDDKE